MLPRRRRRRPNGEEEEEAAEFVAVFAEELGFRMIRSVFAS